MKKLGLTFAVLLIAFCGIWVYRFQNPIDTRPNDATAQQPDIWWENDDLPQADPEWVLDPEIPVNYIPVPGRTELYMIIDDAGNIQEYAKRVQGDDGGWLWEYGINPNIPENYEAVIGLENVYKVVNDDGTISYYKYIRNDDDTFAFVPVDENGEELKSETEDDDFIPENYKRIKGNIYGVYNEHGVCIGYKERKYDEKTQKYYWVDAEKPKDNSESAKPPKPTEPDNSQPTTPQPSTPQQGGDRPENPTTPSEPNKDTYQSVETYTETKVAGGWVITYQTTITKVYSSADGRLLSTKKDGPTEISRTPMQEGDNTVPNPALIAPTLSEEYARVSVGLNYKTDLAKEVLAIINEERLVAGLPGLTMSSSSTTYTLAAIRAADMAIYNHSDFDSPMYGSISDLRERYSIGGGSVAERMWRSGSGQTAESIAARLMLSDGGKITSTQVQDVAIVIVSKGGYYYIDLVYTY